MKGRDPAWQRRFTDLGCVRPRQPPSPGAHLYQLLQGCRRPATQARCPGRWPRQPRRRQSSPQQPPPLRAPAESQCWSWCVIRALKRAARDGLTVQIVSVKGQAHAKPARLRQFATKPDLQAMSCGYQSNPANCVTHLCAVMLRRRRCRRASRTVRSLSRRPRRPRRQRGGGTAASNCRSVRAAQAHGAWQTAPLQEAASSAKHKVCQCAEQAKGLAGNSASLVSSCFRITKMINRT